MEISLFFTLDGRTDGRNDSVCQAKEEEDKNDRENGHTTMHIRKKENPLCCFLFACKCYSCYSFDRKLVRLYRKIESMSTKCE